MQSSVVWWESWLALDSLRPEMTSPVQTMTDQYFPSRYDQGINSIPNMVYLCGTWFRRSTFDMIIGQNTNIRGKIFVVLWFEKFQNFGPTLIYFLRYTMCHLMLFVSFFILPDNRRSIFYFELSRHIYIVMRLISWFLAYLKWISNLYPIVVISQCMNCAESSVNCEGFLKFRI